MNYVHNIQKEKMKKISIFASGSGSNAENIARYFSDSEHIDVDCFVSNKPEAYVHERAGYLGVESFTFPKEEFEAADKVMDFLTERRIDLVVLAGFLLKIPPELVRAFPRRIINIHPALLPKYGGKGMYGDRVHKAVVAAGETESGITVHYVNENYDEGNIIFQAGCKVFPSDTFADVAQKVHALEYEYYPKVIERLLLHPREKKLCV
jgi:phosphoribosylglycinamide formyltransferase-1